MSALLPPMNRPPNLSTSRISRVQVPARLQARRASVTWSGRLAPPAMETGPSTRLFSNSTDISPRAAKIEGEHGTAVPRCRDDRANHVQCERGTLMRRRVRVPRRIPGQDDDRVAGRAVKRDSVGMWIHDLAVTNFRGNAIAGSAGTQHHGVADTRRRRVRWCREVENPEAAHDRSRCPASTGHPRRPRRRVELSQCPTRNRQAGHPRSA